MESYRQNSRSQNLKAGSFFGKTAGVKIIYSMLSKTSLKRRVFSWVRHKL